jgi:hypothetical protein
MGGVLPEGIMQVLNFVVSFVVIAVMFALLFKWMPDADVAWRDVALGAVAVDHSGCNSPEAGRRIAIGCRLDLSSQRL